MVRRVLSSRKKFEAYKQELREQRQPSADGAPAARQRVRSSLELIRRFLGLLGRERGAVGFALATLTVATVLGLIPPAATKFLVDYVLGDEPLPPSIPSWLHLPTDRWSLLLWVTVAVFVLSAVRTAVHLWGRWYATRSTKRVQLALRKRLFAHAARLPLHRVHELRSGGVASVLREDAGAVGDLIFSMLYNPWRALIQLVGSLCVLAWVDWRLLLGAVVMLPLVYATHQTWIKRIRPQFRQVRRSREAVDAHATEAFGGIRVVRAFSRQRSETGRFIVGNDVMVRQELLAWWWSRIVEIVWETIIPLSSGALMLYGGWQVIQGNLTLGDLMMFLVYLLMLLEPLAVLAQSAATFQTGLAALDRVLDLLDEPREMLPTGDSARLSREEVAGRITFENVSFRYVGSERYALRDIALEAEPGQTIALVGPSGAGKTTLCNLVARFYDPTQGRVLLDGRDLRDIEVENYRSLLGVVEQDVFLFDGTIADNIAYADRSASLDDVRRAAEVANAWEFIRDLPDHLDTVIGERGVKLSGGQRQRLAIARAVLADPRILILDEATSNLDSESERLIQLALADLMRGRTCFVIAHRLSTIAHADRIAVLENGSIIELGTHEELMEAGGRYRDMVQLQVAMQQGVSGAAG